MDVPVWGTADPGETVKVTLNGQTRSTKAGPGGKWMVHLRKLKAGGPYEMQVKGKNSITIHDVLVGEVWLASGQSNMVFTVSKKAASFAGMLDEDKEIAAANYPEIRMFTVKESKSYTPQDDPAGEWKVCSPDTVGAFSAVGYLFARDLQQRLHVPVGILTVAYGASTAESWLPREALDADPQLKPMLDRFDTLESFYKTHPGAMAADAPSGPQTINARPGKPGPLRDPVQDQHQPTVLFNGMLHSVIPFAIRGAIWYQGESIVGGKAGITLYPQSKCTPSRAIDMVEIYGSQRLWLNCACDWGQSDPLAVPKTAIEMKRRGHSEAAIDRLIYGNPLQFLSQNPKFQIQEGQPPW